MISRLVLFSELPENNIFEIRNKLNELIDYLNQKEKGDETK